MEKYKLPTKDQIPQIKVDRPDLKKFIEKRLNLPFLIEPQKTNKSVTQSTK